MNVLARASGTLLAFASALLLWCAVQAARGRPRWRRALTVSALLLAGLAAGAAAGTLGAGAGALLAVEALLLLLAACVLLPETVDAPHIETGPGTGRPSSRPSTSPTR